MFRKVGLAGLGLLVAVTAVAAVACGDDDMDENGADSGGNSAATSQITVEEAWARNAPASMNGGGMGSPTEAPGMAKVRGAAYMKITNTGHAGDALIAASSDVANVTEIHESTMNGDQVTMKPVDSIEVPVGETVELKPGGYHVMFIDLKQQLEAGTKFQLELTFEKAGKMTVDVEVRES